MSVTAAQAIANYNANHNVAAQVVSDTAAHIMTKIDGLQTLATASKLASVAITGSTVLALASTTIANDAGALAKITTTYTITPIGTIGATAAAGIPSDIVSKLTAGLAVSDTASNVIGSAAGLVTLNTAGKLVSILATGTLGASAAAGLSSVLVAKLSSGLSVSDTATNITANLDGLQTLFAAGKLTSVVITDTAGLILTAAKIAADAGALGAITTSYTITPSGTIGAAAAAALPTTLLSKLSAGLAVSDTAANITANLDGLQATISSIASIAITGSTVLTIVATTIATDAAALLKISSSFTIAPTGTIGAAAAAGLSSLLAAKLSAGLAVSDTATSVRNNLDGLQTLAVASKLTSIAFTNSGTPSLSITYTQYTKDSLAISKFTGSYGLVVSGVPAINPATLNGGQTFQVGVGAPVIASVANLPSGSAARTFSAWFASTDTTDNICLVSQGTLASYQKAELWIWNTGGPQGRIVFDTQVGYVYATNSAILDGLPHQITATFDPVNGVSIYVDGVAQTVSAGGNGFSAGSVNTVNNGSSVGFGGQYLAGYSGAASFTGTEANGRVYGTALTASQVRLLFTSGSAGVTPLVTAMPLTIIPSAATLQSNSHVTSFSVLDSAANVLAALDTLNSDSKISTIAVTNSGTPSLSITYTQYTNDSSAISKFTGSYGLVVSGVPAINPATLNGGQTFQVGVGAPVIASVANLPSGSAARTFSAWFASTDTTDNICLVSQGTLASYQKAELWIWNTGGPQGRIVFDTQVGYVYATNSAILDGLPHQITATFDPVNGVSIYVDGVAQTVSAGGNGFSAGSVNTVNNGSSVGFGGQYLAGYSGAASFTGTEANGRVYGTALTASQVRLLFTSGSAGVTPLVTAMPLTIIPSAATLQSNSHVTSFSVLDSAANVLAALDTLNSDSKISTISFTNSDTPSLPITYAQYTNDSSAISEFTGSYGLVVSAAPVSAAAALQANSHVSKISFTGTSSGDSLPLAGAAMPVTINLGGDTAAVSAGLSSSSLTFTNVPDAITLGSGASTIQYALQSSSGIETIANFRYGLDQLNLDLLGAASPILKASNTSLNGTSAISIYSSADPKHGVVLISGGTSNFTTAADLLANHLTFVGGHALIS